jgi:hypothetical protein
VRTAGLHPTPCIRTRKFPFVSVTCWRRGCQSRSSRFRGLKGHDYGEHAVGHAVGVLLPSSEHDGSQVSGQPSLEVTWVRWNSPRIRWGHD